MIVFRNMIIGGNWSLRSEPTKLSDRMENCIKRLAEDVLGERKGKWYNKKKTW